MPWCQPLLVEDAPVSVDKVKRLTEDRALTGRLRSLAFTRFYAHSERSCKVRFADRLRALINGRRHHRLYWLSIVVCLGTGGDGHANPEYS